MNTQYSLFILFSFSPPGRHGNRRMGKTIQLHFFWSLTNTPRPLGLIPGTLLPKKFLPIKTKFVKLKLKIWYVFFILHKIWFEIAESKTKRRKKISINFHATARKRQSVVKFKQMCYRLTRMAIIRIISLLKSIQSDSLQ